MLVPKLERDVYPFLLWRLSITSLQHKYASLINIFSLLHRHLINVLVILKSCINRNEQHFLQWRLDIKFLEYQGNNVGFIVNLFKGWGKNQKGQGINYFPFLPPPGFSFLLNVFCKEQIFNVMLKEFRSCYCPAVRGCRRGRCHCSNSWPWAWDHGVS